MTKIETEVRKGINVIKVTGKLTRPEAEGEFRDVADGRFASGARDLLIDLTEVPYLDSSGVGRLVEVLDRARESGGTVKLALVLDGKPHELLALASLDGLFDVYRDVDSALKGFES